MISSRFELSAKLDGLIEFRIPKRSPWSFRTGTGERKVLIPVGRKDPAKYRLLKTVKSIGTSPLGLAVRKARQQLSAMLDDLIQFQGDPRPRNNLGEFSPQGEGGPDPNAMYKTYIIAPQAPGMAPNKSAGLAGAAGLTVLGGAGGALGGHLAKSGLDKIAEALKRAKKAR